MGPRLALLSITPDLISIGVFAAYSILSNIRVIERHPLIEELALEAESEVKERIGDPKRLTENPIIQAYRRFLWRLGVDPTKVRPSSEALARRILRGDRLPRINSLVDSGNIASIKTLVPIGIYDLDKISTPMILRFSMSGEKFKPIGSQNLEVLEAGLPIIVDSRGLVIHIYPHRDSRESMITLDTKKAIVVGCGVPGVPRDLVVNAISIVIDITRNINPQVEASSIVVSP